MKKKRKWLRLLLLFLLSAAAGLYAAAHSPEISGEAEAVQAADSEYIALTSRLTICSEYQLCGHVLEEEIEMPAAYVGLDKQQLRSQLGEISISKFSAQEVVLTRRFHCYCPEHLVAYLEEGTLGIYRTVAGSDEAEPAERLAVSAENLSAAERRALRQGKVFSSMQAVRAYARALRDRE